MLQRALLPDMILDSNALMNGAMSVLLCVPPLRSTLFHHHEYREGLDFGHGVPEHRSRDCTVSSVPPLFGTFSIK